MSWTALPDHGVNTCEFRLSARVARKWGSRGLRSSRDIVWRTQKSIIQLTIPVGQRPVQHVGAYLQQKDGPRRVKPRGRRSRTSLQPRPLLEP